MLSRSYHSKTKWLVHRTFLAMTSPSIEKVREWFNPVIEKFIEIMDSTPWMAHSGEVNFEGKKFNLPTREEYIQNMIDMIEDSITEFHNWWIVFHASDEAEKLRNSPLARWLEDRTIVM